MRRAEVFWGVLLVVLGGLFLLQAMGILRGDVFSWFWPLCIIAAGFWILMGRTGASRSSHQTQEHFAIPLEGATEASLTINHGMGRVVVEAGAAGDDFLLGNAGVGMQRSSRRIGGRLEVNIDAGPSVIPFIGPEGGAWEYRLRPGIPTVLSINAGASRLEVDLTALHVRKFDYDGGASSLRLTLPSAVEHTVVDIDAGAASIEIHVPQGVAARFHTVSVGSLSVDEDRFPARGGGVYESTDYAGAPYRAEINVDGGATSIQLT